MQSLFDMPGEPKELLPHDGSAILHLSVLSSQEASDVFAELYDTVPWEQRSVKMFGKEVSQPRLVAWFGDAGKTYKYSGLTLTPNPWTPPLTRLKSLCETLAQTTFNSALANLYRDGSDGVAWHSDDERELGSRPTITSVSLGAERRFDLRHKSSKETIKVPLLPGSVVVMSGECQLSWEHQIPKSRRVTEPRLNLTFRYVNESD